MQNPAYSGKYFALLGGSPQSWKNEVYNLSMDVIRKLGKIMGKIDKNDDKRIKEPSEHPHHNIHIRNRIAYLSGAKFFFFLDVNNLHPACVEVHIVSSPPTWCGTECCHFFCHHELFVVLSQLHTAA